MKTYTDKQGNKYRQQSGKWQILQGGGWREFESTAYVHVSSEDGEVATIPPTPQSEPPEVAEQKQYAKQREDELFVHFVNQYQSESLKLFFYIDLGDNFDGELLNKGMAETSCDYAQAMIDELKKRGRL